MKYIYICPACGEHSRDMSNMKSDVREGYIRCSKCGERGRVKDNMVRE